MRNIKLIMGFIMFLIGALGINIMVMADYPYMLLGCFLFGAWMTYVTPKF